MEFRRRHLAIAIVVGVVALSCLGVGLSQWSQANSGFGVTESLGEDALAAVSDGHFVVTLESHRVAGPGNVRATILGPDGAQKSVDGAPAEALGAHIIAGTQSLMDQGRYVTSAGWIDLGTGAWHEATWNTTLRPLALSGTTMLATALGGARVVDLTTGLETHLPGADDCEQAGEALLVVPRGVVSYHCLASGAYLSLSANGAILARHDLPLGHSMVAVNGQPAIVHGATKVAALVRQDGATQVLILDQDSLAESGLVDLPVDTDFVLHGLGISEAGWIVEGFVPDEVFAGHVRAVWGQEDVLEGSETGSDLTVFLATFTPPQRVGDRLLLYEGIEPVLAKPGTSDLPALPFFVAGTVLAGVALAWWPYQKHRLATTAAGGLARCLHCGKYRDLSLGFCPDCGWRTKDETRAALPVVNPWDKDR